MQIFVEKDIKKFNIAGLSLMENYGIIKMYKNTNNWVLTMGGIE